MPYREEKTVKVRILAGGRIPFLGGNGPILTPIYLSEKMVNQLIALLGKDKVEIINDEAQETTAEVIVIPTEIQPEFVEVPKEVEIPVEPVQEEEVTPTEESDEEEVLVDEDEEEEAPTEEEEEEVRKPVAKAKKKNKR
jgi:hypothetical protein